jgi:hypothetical protein
MCRCTLAYMRVTVDVDEDIWEGIMEHIIREHKAVYGKYRKKVVNNILALGLKELKKGNVEEFRKALSRDVSEDFLESAEALSKEIRERSRRRLAIP